MGPEKFLDTQQDIIEVVTMLKLYYRFLTLSTNYISFLKFINN